MKLQLVSILRSMTLMFSHVRTRAACLPLARACAVAAVLLAGAADAGAQMFVTTGRDTLRGLPGVELAVESLPPELEREGLNGAAIRAAVDRRLRAAGVRLFASQSENPSDAKPYLYVHVNALEIPGASVYAIAIQVHLRQTLRSPVTSSNIVNAMTWDAHNVVVVPKEQLRSVVTEIEAYVDQFTADWTAVH